MSAAARATAAAAPSLAVQPAAQLEARRRSDRSGPGPAPAVPRFATSLAALPVAPAVQRRCAACEEEESKKTRVQPSLEVGPSGDHYEREADSIAARVMRTPASGGVTARASGSSVRRKCASCDEEEKVRRRGGEGKADAATRLGASAARLTSGGRPLPAHTRAFLEERTGRDLSSVRVHDGAESTTLNRSIQARAFTYENHVWLAAGERPEPTFTMAHEATHVLQQTQPPALDAGGGVPAQSAEPAPARVMRSDLRAFWVQEGVKDDGTLRYNTKIHDAAVKYLREENDLISEAPIPGATSEVVACGENGFADLFQAKPNTTVGVAERCSTVAGTPPVEDFAGQKIKQHQHHTTKRGTAKKAYPHDRDRAPQLSSDGTQIVDIAKAPEGIRIGDMKPGHNPRARAAGLGQIQNYVSGIEAVKRAVNNAPDAMKRVPKTWGGKVETMKATRLKIPDAVHPKKLKGKKDRLRMHYHSEALLPETEVHGQMVIARDKLHPGIWVYVWVPTTDFRGLGKNQPELVAIAGRLEREVIKPLGVSPMSARVSKQPATASGDPTPSPRVVRRRKSNTPQSDAFNYKTWEASRDDIAKSWPRGKLTTTTKPVSGGLSRDDRAELLTSVGAGQAADLYHEQFVDDTDQPLDLKAPARAAGSAATERQIKRLEFWLSFKGKALGLLRRVFGKIFVAGHNAFLRLKKFFKDHKKLQSLGGSTSLIAAALKGLAKILVIVGGAIINRTAQIMAGALVSAAEKRIAVVFGPDIDAVEDKLKAFEVGGKTIEELGQMEEKQLAALFLGDDLAEIIVELKDDELGKRLFGPFEEHINTLASVLDGLSKASKVISVITWAVRVVACLSPPVLGCLWLLAEAAVSWALSMFIGSCWFLKKIYPHIVDLPAVTGIASKLAGGALGIVQKIIPRTLLGDVNLADAVTEASAEKPTESDVDEDCDKKGRQPSDAELALAERLEKLPGAKLAALQEFAARKGWKSGGELNLKNAEELLKYLETTDIDQIKTDLEKVHVSAEGAPGPLVEAAKAGKAGSAAVDESVREAATRKATGAGQGAEGGGEEAGGGGGKGEGTGADAEAGKGKQEVTGGLVEGGSEAGAKFVFKTTLNLPAKITSPIEKTVMIDIHAREIVFENVRATIVISALEKDDAGARVVVFKFKRAFSVKKDFPDGRWEKWSPDKNLGPFHANY